MNEKNEVLGILNDRIEQLNRNIEHFIQFGNKGNSDQLTQHLYQCVRLNELVSIKSSIEYGVRWRNDQC